MAYNRGPLVTTLVIGLAWLFSGQGAFAQASADQIIEALTPKPVTRSLTGQPAQRQLSDSDRTFIESVRHRTRSLSASERDRLADIAQDRPSINLEIYFDFDSAVITPKAEPQLVELGEALRRGSQLKDALMLLNGHTDARGTVDYNQQLSERRSEAVKKYLLQRFQIPVENLTTAGWGKQQPKNKDDPFAAENRRVQIVNVASSVLAQP
ncbi:MAG: OmpA family protein [Xanthobacteraceae bacterium]